MKTGLDEEPSRVGAVLTVVAHHLPRSFHADVLKVVVTPLLVFLQRAALLVTPPTVVTFVRFTDYGKSRGPCVKSVSPPWVPACRVLTTRLQKVVLLPRPPTFLSFTVPLPWQLFPHLLSRQLPDVTELFCSYKRTCNG